MADDGEEFYPTREYQHTWYGHTVLVALFGHPVDFSHLQHNKRALPIITSHAAEHRVRMICAPNAAPANKRIVECGDFLQKTTHRGIWIMSGISADGVVIPPQSAFFLASADCPTLVLQSSAGELIATHAGRECLFDRNMFGDTQSRDTSGVVFRALSHFSGNAEEVYASIFCGIGPAHFTHPTHHPIYGDDNARMIENICARWGRRCFAGEEKDIVWGRLDLAELLKAQLKEAGVRAEHIWHDRSCTRTDIAPTGAPLWWSHRRGGAGRNGIVVLRLS